MCGSCHPILLGNGANELGVFLHIFNHAGVLAAHWTIYDGESGEVGNLAGSTECYGAVDDGEERPKALDIAMHFADEVGNLEWKTDVHNVNRTDVSCIRIKIDPNSTVMPRDNFQQRFADLSEAHNDYCSSCHDVVSPE